MKEKYLVSIDVDKTLVNDQGNILEKSVHAIDCLLSKGNFVAINSGRSFYRSLYPLRDHQSIADQVYVSGFNGAFLVSSKIDNIRRIISAEEMQKSVFSELIDFFRNHSIDYVAFALGYSLEEKIIREFIFADEKSNLSTFFFEVYGKAQEYSQGNIIIQYVSDIKEQICEKKSLKPMKFIVSPRLDECEKVIPRLQERALPISITQTEKQWTFEIMAQGITKKSSLEKLILHLSKNHKIGKPYLVAIGDSPNDTEMLKYADTGILMGNASPSLKQELSQYGIVILPDYYTNNNDGLYQAINDHILSRI